MIISSCGVLKEVWEALGKAFNEHSDSMNERLGKCVNENSIRVKNKDIQ